jgi:4-hydroxyproline epimerase
MQEISIIDSHTGGEPTRVVLAGGPDLGAGPMAERRERFRQFYDDFRRTVVNEPRGNDVVVGALLCPPIDPKNATGVVFFNNVGVLNMCGHGTIGVAATLGYLGRLPAGLHTFETPVGNVNVTYDGRHQAVVQNVSSYRHRKSVPVDVPGFGTVGGDVAWGGNWFYLIEEHGLNLELVNVEQLTDFAWRVRHALVAQKITGAEGGEIDHIELFGPPRDPRNNSRNFVLCPGKAYDRSPCGTGTSAKLACLIADGKLQPNEPWRQESITGSLFTAHAQRDGDRVIPFIQGEAYITSTATLLVDENDPFRCGIPII